MELLVVVATIMVLAGILLPVLAKAKSAARRVQCISDTRQLTLAFLDYKDDHEGLIPREGYDNQGKVTWNNWSQVEDKIAQDVWYNALAPYLGGIRPASYYGENIPERDEFYSSKNLLQCPSARFGNTDVPIAFFSRAMNSQLIERNSAPTISFTRIRDPFRTVLFMDNLLKLDEKVSDRQPWIYLGQPSSDARRFAGRRHGRVGVLSFADGRVEAYLGQTVVQTEGPGRGLMNPSCVDAQWDIE